MPKAELPNTLKGWGVALLASFVGFIAGFLILSMLERVVGP